MIDLGFEVGTGAEVSVPLGHTIVTGQSQKSGKTTALEAMASRCFGEPGGADPAIIAFVTKRGEGSFQRGASHRGGAEVVPALMQPYFVERSDWKFVAATLEATFGEKMKFERAWIVRACKGTSTLAEVRRKAAELTEKSKRSMDRDIYMLLGEYLDEVLPEIEQLPTSAGRFHVSRGVNVMDVVAWPQKMQTLFIASTLSKVAADQENTVVIVPESWQTLPERRNTPVKEPAVEIARKGAAVDNYLWLDSQDIAGVSKEIIRQSSVWLLGVQREANEIRRTLEHIPSGLKKPKADELARLELGQFFACTPDAVTKTYVRPAWMSRFDALAVATGKQPVATFAAARKVKVRLEAAAKGEDGPENAVQFKAEFAKLAASVLDFKGDLERKLIEHQEKVKNEIAASEARLREAVASFNVGLDVGPMPTAVSRAGRAAEVGEHVAAVACATVGAVKLLRERQAAAAPNGKKQKPTQGWTDMEEDLYQKFKTRLISELRDEAPQILRLIVDEPVLEVATEPVVLQADGKTPLGRVGRLYKDGYFGSPKTAVETFAEVRSMGAACDRRTVYGVLEDLLGRGFFTKDSHGYKARPGARVVIKEKS